MGNFLFRCPKLSLLFHVQVFSTFVSHTAYCLEYHLARESNNNKTKQNSSSNLLCTTYRSLTVVSFRVCHFSLCTMSVTHWWSTDSGPIQAQIWQTCICLIHSTAQIWQICVCLIQSTAQIWQMCICLIHHTAQIWQMYICLIHYTAQIWQMCTCLIDSTTIKSGFQNSKRDQKMKVKRSDNPGH